MRIKLWHIIIFSAFIGGACSLNLNNKSKKTESTLSPIDYTIDKYLYNNEIDSAILLINKILSNVELSSLEKGRLKIKLGACLFQNNEITKSIRILNSGTSDIISDFDKIDSLTLKLYLDALILQSNNYRLLQSYDTALFYLENVENELNGINKNEMYYSLKAEVYTWKGLVYYDKGFLKQALNYTRSAINIRREHITSSCKIADNYLLISEIYTYKEDFEKAILYQHKALSIVKDCYTDTSLFYAEKVNNLGLIYYESKDYNKALYYFQICHDILTKHLHNNSPYFASTYNNLGDVYCKLGDIEKGIIQYQKALNTYIENGYYEDTKVIYHNLGNAYTSLGNYTLAYENYNKSLEIFKKYSSDKNVFTCFTYQQLGKLAIIQNQYKHALNYFNLAIIQVCDTSVIDNNFTKEILRNSIISEVELLESLYYKGSIEYSLFKQDNNYKYLTTSIKTFTLATQLIDIIRNKFDSEESKILINKIREPLLSNFLVALLKEREKGQNYDLDDEILKCIERKKYTALRSMMHHEDVIYNINLPLKTVALEDSLRKQIRYLKNIISIFNSQNNSLNSELKDLNESLFSCLFSYDSLLIQIENHYPDYVDNLYAFKYEGIKSTQQKIKNDSIIILNYNITDSILVILAISKNKYLIFDTIIDSNLRIVKDRLIKSIVFADNTSFYANSKLLYDVLINPIKGYIKPYNHLIIIPDHDIAELPFEVLLPESSNIKDSIQYLVEDYIISYQYSLNLFNAKLDESNLYNQKSYKYYYCGFAPFIGSNKEHFNPLSTLPNSKHEVEKISEIFKNAGKTTMVYLGETTSKKKIAYALKNSRIVHLATHSGNYLQTNQEINLLTNIQINIIAIDGKENIYNPAKIYLADIYNMEINSDLVTLGSCSSGLGEKINGEGILSLVRGFYCSGANNIVYTLWNISDKHTKEFMLSFYNYINNGYTYSHALQKTKIDFINSNFQLPQFWSGILINN